MRCPSACELVTAWELGLQQPPVERALTLLSLSCSEPREELARLSIGRRDARLLELCELLFGPQLDAFSACPACAASLEYSFTVRELNMHPSLSPVADEVEAVRGDIRLRLRLPNTEDLSAMSTCPNAALARRTLAERCVVEAVCGQIAIPSETLSEEMLDFAAATLSQADPAADQQIKLGCSACGHSWQIVFDIERFLWVKVNAFAKRLLTQVHVLAGAYGWTEAEILALGSGRRQFYLEMVV